MEKCGMRLLRTERRPHRGGALEDFVVRGITREAWEKQLGQARIDPHMRFGASE
jgi:hypothetical protein